ncbi:MAG: hypothetical protein U9P36_04005 [Thermodesulfobacteriota bacterium]|nr:hypothetical protein [Thermodesulfobacteriota bacterium]
MTEKEAKLQEIMDDFCNRTGLTAGSHSPKRYLWTDAYSVCNFLEIFQQTVEKI